MSNLRPPAPTPHPESACPRPPRPRQRPARNRGPRLGAGGRRPGAPPPRGAGVQQASPPYTRRVPGPRTPRPCPPEPRAQFRRPRTYPAAGLRTQRRESQPREARRRSLGTPAALREGPPSGRGAGCGQPGFSPAPRALPAGPPRPASPAPTLPARPPPIPRLRSSQPGWPRPEALSWAASLFGSWPLFNSELTEPVKSELGALCGCPGIPAGRGGAVHKPPVCSQLPGWLPLPRPRGLSQVLLSLGLMRGSVPGETDLWGLPGTLGASPWDPKEPPLSLCLPPVHRNTPITAPSQGEPCGPWACFPFPGPREPQDWREEDK